MSWIIVWVPMMFAPPQPMLAVSFELPSPPRVQPPPATWRDPVLHQLVKKWI